MLNMAVVTNVLDELKNKYVFLDVDGTLSEYRFNNHVNGRDCLGGQSLRELLFENVFLSNRPLETMMRIIQTLDSDKLFTLGAFCTNYELMQKYEWLGMYYPSIPKDHYIFICSSDLKVLVLEEYSKKFNIDRCDIVIIDDRHKTIQDAEQAGFIGYHVTSFVI